VFDEKF
jgi:hypothetical protein